jgi:hypothetical protein
MRLELIWAGMGESVIQVAVGYVNWDKECAKDTNLGVICIGTVFKVLNLDERVRESMNTAREDTNPRLRPL